VDSPGDNLLAEFASVIDAVECAVQIQQELKSRNAEVPPARRMEFRIGINLGDVIVEEDRIYGDGVNIAARLESLAEAGGICISGTVYDQVETKLAFGYDPMGEQTVKNIAKPVRVYRVLHSDHVEPTSVPATALPLPDKPSIAVLPFVNMSSDPEQEYFSDGITEDLITDLSKLSGLFVIARNSVLPYKGKAVKPAQVSAELGVRYLVEGSVRKAGNRVRITAQLVDVTTGYHRWAERYDRDVQDIFAVQDEVTRSIVSALEVTLTDNERRRLGRPLTNNVEAYDCYLRGLELHERSTVETNMLAQQLFAKAITLDPHFATAHAYLGWAHFAHWAMGWSHDPHTLDLVQAAARQAVALDPQLPVGHRLLGMVSLWKRQHDLAIVEVEHALALDPNEADTYASLGEIVNFAGKPDETPPLIDKAMRLNPHYPPRYLWCLGHSYYLRRRYDEAIATFKRALARNPEFVPANGFLAITYGEMGLIAEAKAAAVATSQVSPRFSALLIQERLPYKDPTVTERVLNALRQVGLG
jgi:adenylate cyclase